MAGSIPQNFIDDLLTRVDIVEIVDARVSLKKAGRDFKACCPFHSEKTPSFVVSREKQLYHCFGCGASGSVIRFLMDYDHMEFVEAVEDLAKSAGISVPYETRSGKRFERQSKDSTSLYELMEKVAHFYSLQLRKHPQKDSVVKYLKNRGLTGAVAKNFEIGFAPSGWDNLSKEFVSSESQKQLVDTGMLVRKDNGQVYDRFRNRVMFPIRDRRGRVVAFGGRVILKEDMPKYLNSPETEIFHKSHELYGLNALLNKSNANNSIVVVEGYMDVVSLSQHGVGNSVATLGTAITEHHIQTLVKYADVVVFCFDGDEAGKKAAWRALEVSLPRLSKGTQFKFMFLPDGEDPDSMVRRVGAEGFYQMVDQSMPLSDFLIEHLLKQADYRSIDGQVKLVEVARPLMSKLPQGSYVNLLASRLSEYVQMPPDEIIKQIFPKTRNEQQIKNVDKFLSTEKPSNIRVAIAMLLERPNLALLVDNPEKFRQLNLPGVALLERLLVFVKDSPNITTGALLERWRDRQESVFLGRILRWEHHVPESGYETEFLGALSVLEDQLRQQEIDELTQRSKRTALSSQEKERLSHLFAGNDGTRH